MRRLNVYKSIMVECPKCHRGRSLTHQEVEAVAKSELLKCICGHRFSFDEGVSQVISSTNVFTKMEFVSNFSQYGTAKITVGELERVVFEEPFTEIHKVFLTPYKYLVHVEPIGLMPDSFDIISSKPKKVSQLIPDKVEMSWLAYGNSKDIQIPFWQKLLSNAKNYEVNRDFRMAIIECETAFEIYIDNILVHQFRDKLSNRFVDDILRRTSLDDKLNIWFKEATGKQFSERLRTQWNEKVRKIRNHILHRGKTDVTEDDAIEAFATAFKIFEKYSSFLKSA